MSGCPTRCFLPTSALPQDHELHSLQNLNMQNPSIASRIPSEAAASFISTRRRMEVPLPPVRAPPGQDDPANPFLLSSAKQHSMMQERALTHPPNVPKEKSLWSQWDTLLLDSVVVLSTLALLCWVSFIATTDGRTIDDHYNRHENALSVVSHVS